MARESCVDVPVFSEEVTISHNVDLRRHSFAKTSSGNNIEKVVSHYRRASTGSCHDFCKYGKNIALEPMKISSIPNSFGKTSSENNAEKVVPRYRRASIGSCHDSRIYGKNIELEPMKISSIPSFLRKTSSENNTEKVVPHYRRASIGSCHDFCKYGKNIALEPMKISFIPNSFGKTSSENNVKKVFPRYRRASIGSIHDFSKYGKNIALEQIKISSISNSFGETSSENNVEKVVPHYRRASIGSCHDFCKYGKNIALEPTKVSSRNNVEKVVPRYRRASIGSYHDFGKYGKNIELDPMKLCERKQLLQSSQKNIGEVVIASSVRLQASTDSEPTKMVVVKRRESIDSQLHISNASGTTKVIKTGPNQLVQPLLKSTFQSVKTNPISFPQIAKSSSKSTPKKTHTSSKLSGNHVTLMNLDSINVVSPRASLSSKPSQKRIAGINIHRSLLTSLHVKNHPKPRKVELEEQYNEVEEKTLHIIKIESKDQTFQFDQNENLNVEFSNSQITSPEDQEKCDYEISEFKEDSCLGNNEKENMENLDSLDLDMEEIEKPQKGENENLVETQIENSSPRNLRENAIDVKVDSYETVAIIGVENVVLRYQDVKGKKDEQVLVNNVVEETTSDKLVETQKGMVKALIRVFEIMSSLNKKKA